MDLIFILLLLILVDLEVAQLIALLGVRYNTQPVTQVVLLEVLLGKILQIPADNKHTCLLQCHKMIVLPIKWHKTAMWHGFSITFK